MPTEELENEALTQRRRDPQPLDRRRIQPRPSGRWRRSVVCGSTGLDIFLWTWVANAKEPSIGPCDSPGALFSMKGHFVMAAFKAFFAGVKSAMRHVLQTKIRRAASQITLHGRHSARVVSGLHFATRCLVFRISCNCKFLEMCPLPRELGRGRRVPRPSHDFCSTHLRFYLSLSVLGGCDVRPLATVRSATCAHVRTLLREKARKIGPWLVPGCCWRLSCLIRWHQLDPLGSGRRRGVALTCSQHGVVVMSFDLRREIFGESLQGVGRSVATIKDEESFLADKLRLIVVECSLMIEDIAGLRHPGSGPRRDLGLRCCVTAWKH